MKHCLLLLFLFLSLRCAAQNSEYRGDGMDDYLQYLPISSVFVMKLAGVESASTWDRLGVNVATSYALSAGVTYGLKHLINDTRPDGTDRRAFPSGHSMVAFAGATVLHKEFHHVSPWISVAGYGVATLVAVDRVHRNRHEWDDVAAGAAIGMLGTAAGYWIGDKLTGKKSRYAVGVGANGISLTLWP